MIDTRAPALHVTVGPTLIPGFDRIVFDPAAAVRLDAPDESYDVVLLDRAFEHCVLAQAVRLLKECRRVLRPGGQVRVITTDLARLVRRYHDPEVWAEDGLEAAGFDWQTCRGQVLMEAVRGRAAWVYDEGATARVARLVGLRYDGAPGPRERSHPLLRAAGPAGDGLLVIEFDRPDRAMCDGNLVSILIPLYKSEYFAECLQSALAQTWPDIEIIVTNDGDDEAARATIDRFNHDPRFGCIRYHANSTRLGGVGNTVYALSLACGVYIKYLFDDDVLEPECVARLVSALRAHPSATLATSHRTFINERGVAMPENAATRRPVGVDSLISGRSATHRMLSTSINFIGEPSTYLWRRDDLAPNRPNYVSIAGEFISGNGDVTIATSLLAQGDLVYLTETLSHFRVHAQQESTESVTHRLCYAAWPRLRAAAEKLGLFDPQGERRLEARPIVLPPWWSAETRARVAAARAARASGRAREVVPTMEALASEHGADTEMALELAETHLDAGNPGEALKRVSPVLQRRPHAQRGYVLAARAARQLGDAKGARSILATLEQISPLVQHLGGAVNLEGVMHLATRARFLVAPIGVAALLSLHVEYALPAHGPLLLDIELDGVHIDSARLENHGDSVVLRVPVPRDRDALIEVRWWSRYVGVIDAAAIPGWLRLVTMTLDLA